MALKLKPLDQQVMNKPSEQTTVVGQVHGPGGKEPE
jgi:hypothetical protein